MTQLPTSEKYIHCLLSDLVNRLAVWVSLSSGPSSDLLLSDSNPGSPTGLGSMSAPLRQSCLLNSPSTGLARPNDSVGLIWPSGWTFPNLPQVKASDTRFSSQPECPTSPNLLFLCLSPTLDYKCLEFPSFHFWYSYAQCVGPNI